MTDLLTQITRARELREKDNSCSIEQFDKYYTEYKDIMLSLDLDAIQTMAEENESLKKAINIQRNAVKTLDHCRKESERIYEDLYNEEKRKEKQMATLESEKDMNAILTDDLTELRAWKAEAERIIKSALHYKGGWREAITELEDHCSEPVRLRNMMAASDQLDNWEQRARAFLKGGDDENIG